MVHKEKFSILCPISQGPRCLLELVHQQLDGEKEGVECARKLRIPFSIVVVVFEVRMGS